MHCYTYQLHKYNEVQSDLSYKGCCYNGHIYELLLRRVMCWVPFLLLFHYQQALYPTFEEFETLYFILAREKK
jgi:hypothetical protein